MLTVTTLPILLITLSLMLQMKIPFMDPLVQARNKQTESIYSKPGNIPWCFRLTELLVAKWKNSQFISIENSLVVLNKYKRQVHSCFKSMWINIWHLAQLWRTVLKKTDLFILFYHIDILPNCRTTFKQS